MIRESAKLELRPDHLAHCSFVDIGPTESDRLSWRRLDGSTGALRPEASGGKERWYKDLYGNYTWLLLPHTEEKLRAMAPDFNWGTPFHYDPMPTLRASSTPQLWILGGRDYEAPAAETSRRIRSLMADGRPLTLALYQQAEHGMTLFEVAPNGERVSTRFAPGYFRMMRDFIRDGRLSGPYGDAQITAPER